MQNGTINAAKSVKSHNSVKNAAKAAKAQKSPKAHKSAQTPSERSYKLSAADVKELKAEAVKGFVNPYRESSSYAAVVSGLHNCGVGRVHAWDKVVAAVVAVGLPSGFKSKEKRNENGLGFRDRIIQNVRVVSRVKDYGAKLVQVGYVVKTEGKNGAGLFKA